MSVVVVTVNTAAAARALTRLATAHVGELMEGIGAEVESQTRRRIATEKRGPDGAMWRAWSPRYARTRHAGHSLLRADGGLLDSIQPRVDGATVRVGSNLRYAAIHQFGGTIRIPARQQTLHFRGRRFARSADADRSMVVTIPAHTVTIPARPWLGLSPAQLADLRTLTADWLAALV